MAANEQQPHAASTVEDGCQPRLICVEIDRLKLYDRNPRQSRNPEYDRIKQSILSHGLEQPLLVAKRPGDTDYVVTAGGNTRLQILKELYAASKDPAYSMVNCIEVGWQDEAHALLGHIRENSLRGDLNFAERAAAVVAFADMLAEERGGERVTGLELRRALSERGVPINAAVLSYMRYAATFLMPAMPVALSDGLGWHSVARIRKLQRAASRFWVRRGVGSADEFDAVFAELCRRNDGPDWQFDTLRRAVERELAEASDLSIQYVRVSVLSDEFHRIPRASAQGDSSPSEPKSTQPARNAQSPADNVDETLTVTVEFRDENNHGQRPNADPFSALRQRAFTIAHGLAVRFGLGELVIPLPECGNGFLLSDLPDPYILAQAEPERRAAIGTMWWQLLAFSETVAAPPDVIEARLPTDSGLREVIQNQTLELLSDRIQIVEAAYLADAFWASLPAQDWQDWLYLAHTHREIRGKVIETECPLWSAWS